MSFDIPAQPEGLFHGIGPQRLNDNRWSRALALALYPERDCMADLLDDDPFDYLVLPDEPLTDGWSNKWDDEALDYRFGRFGLELKRGPQGIAIVHSISGHHLRVPDLDNWAVERPFSEICEVLHDMEIAEFLKRVQLDKDGAQDVQIERTKSSGSH